MIVIFSKNFGPSYTGATKHTFYLFQHLALRNDVVVICKNCAGFDESGVTVHRYKNIVSAIVLLLKLAPRGTKVYNDDHMSYLLALLRRKYVFTYHGNWPDLMFLSWTYFLKGLYFIPMYVLGLIGASKVIHVSGYMSCKWKRFNHSSAIIYNATYNGFAPLHPVSLSLPLDVLCLGNVIIRKYERLLKMLKKQNEIDVRFHIFGNLVDKHLVSQLSQFPNVFLHGFSNTINFLDYHALACFSKSENMPLSIVEALVNNLPVVSTNVGGVREVVNSSNGILLSGERSIGELKNRIIQESFAFDDNTVLEQFSKQYALNKYEELFQ
jgi:glycosyltransferase involved in cell wall biosynthesis